MQKNTWKAIKWRRVAFRKKERKKEIVLQISKRRQVSIQMLFFHSYSEPPYLELPPLPQKLRVPENKCRQTTENKRNKRKKNIHQQKSPLGRHDRRRAKDHCAITCVKSERPLSKLSSVSLSNASRNFFFFKTCTQK